MYVKEKPDRKKVCISETYLDSTVDDKTIEITGHNLIRADYPNNQERRGVYLYFKGNLSIRQIEISHFVECLLCQIKINNKKDYIIVLYKSPSQNSTEFNNFQHNLEKILSDIKQLGATSLIVLGNFNAKTKTWWTHDILMKVFRLSL